MIVRSVKLDNFGPFFGSHSLELSVEKTVPVILIHGENLRGKTSIFKAIRWALYGRVQDRLGKSIPSFRLISYDALEAADYHMSVVLEFEHDGRECVLERHVQSDHHPSNDKDLSTTLFFKRDGYFEPAAEIPEIVGEMLHEDIARFFLFDGEMLSAFEVLLSESGRDAELVKDSVEQILGLPVLQLMVEDMQNLRRDSERRLLKQMRGKKEQGRLLASAQQLSHEIDAIDRDLGNLREQLSEVEEEHSRLHQRLNSFSEIKADVREREALETEIAEITKEQKDTLRECQQLLQSSWWMPVVNRADEKLKQFAELAQEEQSSVERAGILGAEVDNIKRALTGDDCPVCGQSISSAAFTRLERKLAETQARLETLAGMADRYADAVVMMNSLRPFTRREGFAQFRDRELNYRRLGIRKRKKERQVKSIEGRLSQHDDREIGRTEDKYQHCIVQLNTLRNSIDSRTKERTVLETNLSRHYEEIERLPNIDPRTVSEKAVHECLEDIFTTAVDRFRETVRNDVEQEASEILRALTTEPGYDRLAINDQYGLSIVDSSQRVIHDRSAGAEQIVALSLVGALNRCAVREGPVIMDTPFGRLDVGHRKNILQFVSTMSHQVVMLVHSGEVDRDRDLVHLEGKVGREYWLIRDGSSTRSRITSSNPAA